MSIQLRAALLQQQRPHTDVNPTSTPNTQTTVQQTPSSPTNPAINPATTPAGQTQQAQAPTSVAQIINTDQFQQAVRRHDEMRTAIGQGPHAQTADHLVSILREAHTQLSTLHTDLYKKAKEAVGQLATQGFSPAALQAKDVLPTLHTLQAQMNDAKKQMHNIQRRLNTADVAGIAQPLQLDQKFQVQLDKLRNTADPMQRALLAVEMADQLLPRTEMIHKVAAPAQTQTPTQTPTNETNADTASLLAAASPAATAAQGMMSLLAEGLPAQMSKQTAASTSMQHQSAVQGFANFHQAQSSLVGSS